MLELNRYGHAYRAIYSGTAKTSLRMRDAYERLIKLNVTTAMPLLVWLTTLTSDKLWLPTMSVRYWPLSRG